MRIGVFERARRRALAGALATVLAVVGLTLTTAPVAQAYISPTLYAASGGWMTDDGNWLSYTRHANGTGGNAWHRMYRIGIQAYWVEHGFSGWTSWHWNGGNGGFASVSAYYTQALKVRY